MCLPGQRASCSPARWDEHTHPRGGGAVAPSGSSSPGAVVGAGISCSLTSERQGSPGLVSLGLPDHPPGEPQPPCPAPCPAAAWQALAHTQHCHSMQYPCSICHQFLCLWFAASVSRPAWCGSVPGHLWPLTTSRLLSFLQGKPLEANTEQSTGLDHC